MRNITNRQKPQKSRRTFLQSLGTITAGLAALPSSILASGRNSGTLSGNLSSIFGGESVTVLPGGVKAVWDISKAYRETTPTRERICINGLWEWQPTDTQTDQAPQSDWGYFKVPGNWPGIRNWMQKESQRIYPHPSWQDKSLNDISSAWYRREFAVPASWANRRIILRLEYVNSSAVVFVDGAWAGEILFPAGEIDLTAMCLPGKKYTLSMKVTALPLQDVVAVYSDTNAPRQGKGLVARRGLCGDVYLCSAPLKANIREVRVITSFRRGEITFKTGMENLTQNSSYTLRAVITEKGTGIAEFKSRDFKLSDLTDGYMAFTERWKPDKLWDSHTPGNMYDVSISLLENSQLADTTLPQRFGFREFWIEGRDFYLNGTRIFLSTVPFDNAQVGAALANYEGAMESMKRLKSFGINLVYTHNYGCEPGTHLSFEEILKAADDCGMMISLSQPHFGQYNWTAADADQNNGYALHAKFYTEVAHNHPSVVFYSMNHNGCGYSEDMNPDQIDGINRKDSPWGKRNVDKALRTEAIVKALDDSRIIYHHSAGNLSSMHISNFYPNWVPIQELNDWFEHWATVGVKPLFICEFGAPFTWDWAIYRGWYKGKREFGSAQVPWEFCLAEWNAQFLGDQAYKISEFEKKNLRWEAQRFRAGAVWSRNSYPYNLDSRDLEERNPVFAMHIGDNWRAFRTWNLSVSSPWHHAPYWRLRDGADNGRKDFDIDWESLQRPGLSPDFILARADRMDLDIAFAQSDWTPSVAARALIQNNMSLLAYIAGKSGAFTGKNHNFLPGTEFEKQLVIINNSRETVTCECSWTLNLTEAVNGAKTVTISTGQQERVPLRFDLPASLMPGNFDIKTTVKFSNVETQKDSFTIHILPSLTSLKSSVKTALFDPKGETSQLLDRMGVRYQSVDAGADLAGYDLLIVGREALRTDNRAPDIKRVRDGLKVIIFEQTSEVLEKRFGFRVQEYGLRKAYKRISNHPAMEGIENENLCDWHGEATILPPKLKYEVDYKVFDGAPTVKWCDIPVTRLWRCGNRGNVASVLIEKPACGNFLPLIDGGYSLQYSPLMEYREGKGMVLFCQMDVTGRTESEPAAEAMVRNMLSYVSGWKPVIKRQAVYAGDPAGLVHLEKAGVNAVSYKNHKLTTGEVLILGPGAKQELSSEEKAIGKWIRSGGHLLAIGLDQDDSGALLPFKVSMKKEEHIAAFFGTMEKTSPFAGIGPADVHNRAPKEISLVSGGAELLGNGVLAKAYNFNVVFCQLAPWQSDYSKEQHNIKQTYRRSSYLLSRLLGNLGVESSTPVLDRFGKPIDSEVTEKRWLQGLYLDLPEEWDDPYRFFRW
jgi:beta-galactosidase